jgi:hypothetical protein
MDGWMDGLIQSTNQLAWLTPPSAKWPKILVLKLRPAGQWRPAETFLPARNDIQKKKYILSSFQFNPFTFVSFNPTVHYFEKMNLSFVI